MSTQPPRLASPLSWRIVHRSCPRTLDAAIGRRHHCSLQGASIATPWSDGGDHRKRRENTRAVSFLTSLFAPISIIDWANATIVFVYNVCGGKKTRTKPLTDPIQAYYISNFIHSFIHISHSSLPSSSGASSELLCISGIVPCPRLRIADTALVSRSQRR